VIFDIRGKTKMAMFENGVLREGVTGSWGILNNGELHNLYCSLMNIIITTGKTTPFQP
jgi:hypothetical protein